MRIYAHTGARAFEMRPMRGKFENGSGSRKQEKEECAFTHLI